ncbi:MAG: flagellar basal body L-ring protein FlgH [Deltaproteobacteria bacterium]|nr:MAG: flagellar basal body L-ring protein FlgH [Deltaproteobacteria bacterium]
MRWPVLLGLLLLAACARVASIPVPPPAAVALPPPPPPPNGSLWHPELAANYPFLDVRAHFPGDLLTVVVSEQSQGKKDATTETTGESSISASVEDFFGIPAAAVKFLPNGFNPQSVVKAETKRSSKGDGTTTREGALTANITVRVVALDPNGNLYVRGDKIVSVNRENQHIVLSGTVRPEDIASDNSVLSSRLADARIDYYGSGVVGDKQNVPLTHRLFDWVWPF